jgi:hypothetical protein
MCVSLLQMDRGYGRPSTAVFVEMIPQSSFGDREALLGTIVASMDEMTANAKAAEKRAVEAEQRVIELQKNSRRSAALIVRLYSVC